MIMRARQQSISVLALVVLSGPMFLSLGQSQISHSLFRSSEPLPHFSFMILTPDTLELRAGKVRPVYEERSKSTGLAMLLSAVAPGAGQFYAERYWTIPIIWGFGYYFGSVYLQEDKLYQDYRSQFSSSVDADTLHRGDGNLLSLRNFYRDERDRFAIYFALTYLLNIVDAYVGASLYGFEVSENLGGSSKIQLRIPLARPASPSRR